MPKTAVAEVPDFFEFYQSWSASFQPSSQRRGQYAFNYLYEIRPDVADQIRGSLLDPFHWSDYDWKMRKDKFWNRVMDLWEA